MINNRLRFTCKFNPLHTESDARYEITWYQGPPTVQLASATTTVISGSSTPEAHLENTEEEHYYCLGTTVCTLYAAYRVKVLNKVSKHSLM